MCASYGLDPRFSDPGGLFAGETELLGALRDWAVGNADETLLPTGKNLRNLNPLVRDSGGQRRLSLGWWGYLVDGAPAKFASINTRSERLATGAGAHPATAVVPATSWFELQKPSRQWFRYAGDGVGGGAGGEASGDTGENVGDIAPPLFALAAVTQPGRLQDGSVFTCFSLLMRPAPAHLAAVHDRVPLLIPTAFMADWLAGEAPARDLIEAAQEASDHALAEVHARPIARRP